MGKEVDKRLIPEVNIGTLGHVDHGKSTLVEALTGKWPAQHSEELKRGITIKLGYADATIYKCKNHFTTAAKCLTDNCECEPQRTVSFVDAPGHETLMATVLSAASLMDGVLFLIAANEKCPQPQTAEHLNVLNLIGQKKIIVVQSKVDLVSEERAQQSYTEIKEFLKGSVAETAPIIPVSAQMKVGIPELIEAIEEIIPTPERNNKLDTQMLVVRSFDVNKPGAKIKDLKGGVVGGALLQGFLKVGEKIEIRPGIKIKEQYVPIVSKIVGLQKAGKDIEEAGPGGLLGVLTELDPALTKADSLAGSVAGISGKMPPVIEKLTIKFSPIGKSEPIKLGEQVMISIGAARTVGIVKTVKKGNVEFELKLPVCSAGDRAVFSRFTGEGWKLIGWGQMH